MLQVATLDILSIQPSGIGTAASAAPSRSADAADFAETLDRRMRAAGDEPAETPSDEPPPARADQPDRHRRSTPEDRTEDEGAAAEAAPRPDVPAPTDDADVVAAAAAAPVIVQDATPATPVHGGGLAGQANLGIAAPRIPGSAATQAPTPPQAPTAPPPPPPVPGAAPPTPLQAPTAPPPPPPVPGAGGAAAMAGQRLPQPIVLTQRFALPLSRPTAQLTAGTSLIPAQAAALAASAGPAVATQTIDQTTEAARQLAVGKLPTAEQKLLHRLPGTARLAATTGAKGPTAAAAGNAASIAGGAAQGPAAVAATSAQTFVETLLARDATADTRAPGANARPSFAAAGGGTEGATQLSVDGPGGPNNLTTAARPTGGPAAAPRPHQPVHQIAVQIQQGLKQDSDRISIRLHRPRWAASRYAWRSATTRPCRRSSWSRRRRPSSCCRAMPAACNRRLRMPG